jgi:hypothetical protein
MKTTLYGVTRFSSPPCVLHVLIIFFFFLISHFSEYGWATEEPVFDCWRGEIFIFFEMPRSALGLTQLPIDLAGA